MGDSVSQGCELLTDQFVVAVMLNATPLLTVADRLTALVDTESCGALPVLIV